MGTMGDYAVTHDSFHSWYSGLAIEIGAGFREFNSMVQQVPVSKTTATTAVDLVVLEVSLGTTSCCFGTGHGKTVDPLAQHCWLNPRHGLPGGDWRQVHRPGMGSGASHRLGEAR